MVTGFLVYTALFHLAVIGTGLVCIILGYRLFLRGVMPESSRSDVEGQAGNIRLTVKNAAPGTCFALFGCFTIGIMLIQGGPQLMIEDLPKVADAERVGEMPLKRLTMKGGLDMAGYSEENGFLSLLAPAMRLQQAGDDEAALAAYGKALAMPEVTLFEAAKAFNQVAWLYLKQRRTDEALPLARLAVQVDSKNGRYRDTLANVLYNKALYNEALDQARLAVDFMPGEAAHHHTLALCLKKTGDETGGRAAAEEAARLDPLLDKALGDFP